MSLKRSPFHSVTQWNSLLTGAHHLIKVYDRFIPFKIVFGDVTSFSVPRQTYPRLSSRKLRRLFLANRLSISWRDLPSVSGNWKYKYAKHMQLIAPNNQKVPYRWRLFSVDRYVLEAKNATRYMDAADNPPATPRVLHRKISLCQSLDSISMTNTANLAR
jgi:hypothetical protein